MLFKCKIKENPWDVMTIAIFSICCNTWTNDWPPSYRVASAVLSASDMPPYVDTWSSQLGLWRSPLVRVLLTFRDFRGCSCWNVPLVTLTSQFKWNPLWDRIGDVLSTASSIFVQVITSAAGQMSSAVLSQRKLVGKDGVISPPASCI